MREAIYQCPGTQAMINSTQLSSWTDFYVRRRDVFLTTDHKISLMKRQSVVSPMSTLYMRAVDSGLFRLFSLAVLPPGPMDGPEIVDYQFLTFDTAQIAASTPALKQVLNGIPELSDKLVLDITSNYSRSADRITNLPNFQAMCVRDLLSRSYFTGPHGTWLTATLTQFLCKVYIISLGDCIAQWANLPNDISSLVRVILGYYFQSRVSSAHDARAILRSDPRAFGIFEPAIVDQAFGVTHDVLGKDTIDSLDEALHIISSLGIDRLKVDKRLLLSRLRSYGSDPFVVRIALEYPPYWAYMVLMAVSGYGKVMSNKLKSSRLWEESRKFSDELARSAMFIPALS